MASTIPELRAELLAIVRSARRRQTGGDPYFAELCNLRDERPDDPHWQDTLSRAIWAYSRGNLDGCAAHLERALARTKGAAA